MILGQTARLTITGLAFGLLGALATSWGMSKALFGATALDPATLFVFTTLLAGVAMTASYLPALKAARRNPMKTLRSE
jgi:putative ABC transport system permease protein